MIHAIGELSAVRASRIDVYRGDVRTNADATLTTAIADRPAITFVSPTVDRLHGELLRPVLARAGIGADDVVVVHTGEPRKAIETVMALVQRASEANFSRRGVFVGIGGGVLLDVVGLAASLFRRGVPHIMVGTTLLAQVDAAVGLKCGVNAGNAKNLIGAFYPPEVAITDGGFLSTVSERHMRCGLAEMIKLALVRDAALFEALECHGRRLLSPVRDDATCRDLIDRAIIGMLAELQTDPYEADLQRRVDFGHTISPALESRSSFALPHGEAVAVDIAFFAAVSNLLGTLSQQELERILALLGTLGLPRWHDLLSASDFIYRALATVTAHRGMRLRLPLLNGIGATRFLVDRAELPNDILDQALDLLRGVAVDR